MPMLTDQNRAHYPALLGYDVLDASRGILFTGATKLIPEDINRTILIGLGGTGIRTIDFVKGAISKRMDPSWKKYVAFLAIDSDWTDLEHTVYLDNSEKVMITRPGAHLRMHNPHTYPLAARRFALDAATMRIASIALSGPCAGGRFQAKWRLHDKVPGTVGVDEEIVHKLSAMKAHKLAPLTSPQGKYQVYVIGSCNGGTGSGSFMDMPALIRKVFTNPGEVIVNGMLYLPDTLAHLDPNQTSRFYANGYATLKELNYYMGMYMRPEYSETWSYNDAASPELTYKTPSMEQEGFMNIPYLIGTIAGPDVDTSRIAQETIAEFLINLLTRITTPDAGAASLTHSFLSNAISAVRVGNKLYQDGSTELEAPGEAHEFPKRFGAIGFAKAAVPHDLIRAYTVGRVCELAGLKPVSSGERASLIAANVSPFLPFRAKDDLLNAVEGTALAERLLKPLNSIMQMIHRCDVDFCRELDEPDIRWNYIRNGYYDQGHIVNRIESRIMLHTNSAAMDDLQKRICEAFDQFRRNVQNYVFQEGPYAFANLFRGNFVPVEDNVGCGIVQMIQNLMNGNCIDGRHVNFPTVTECEHNLRSVRNQIMNTQQFLLPIMTHRQKEQCATWREAYNRWCSVRIVSARRDFALGEHGAINRSFMIPAAKLANELDAFGCILETMTDVYKHHGRMLDSYEAFCGMPDSLPWINLAPQRLSYYHYLKDKADQAVASANAKKLRDQLISHFFDRDTEGIPNSRHWLEYPSNISIILGGGDIRLVHPEMSVPARTIFDLISAAHIPEPTEISIEDFFHFMVETGINIRTVAGSLINRMYFESQPLFNGNISQSNTLACLLYPAALHASTFGQQIAQELHNAATGICPSVLVYTTSDADSIMFCRQADALEVYRLRELAHWEKYYEIGASCICNPHSMLHGLSPDVTESTDSEGCTTYTENMSWADYPGITVPASDPRVPDPNTGEISREGRIRIEQDKLIASARELGVLYSEKTPAGWIIKRVFCDNQVLWRFDAEQFMHNLHAGLLPKGRELPTEVAQQNEMELESISRRVCLNMGGVLDMACSSEELAWKYASRILRAHVPMYIEVRETLKKFEAWVEGFTMMD